MGLSGKCDFEDTCSICGADRILKDYQIYVGRHNLIPLKIESEKDLVAYYPYLVYTMCGSKEDGGVIYLSDISYIDMEEEESLTWKINILKKYHRKCKRYKISFDDTEALKLITLNQSREPKQYELEIINRVKNLGEQATIDGIHDDWHDRMRDEWYNLMINVGWENSRAYRWVYGLDRWLEKYNKSIDKKG